MHGRRAHILIPVLVAIGLLAGARIAAAEGGPGDLWQTFAVNDGLRSGNVAAVFPAQDGTLWFGTDAGVSRYNGRWQSFGEQGGLPPGRVRAIMQTKDGRLWFGTRLGGVVRCAADGSACSQPWTVAQGLPDNDVRALLSGGSNANGVWVATAKGLAYLNGQRAVPESALAGVEICSLAGGTADSLLVGTAGRGVWRRDASGAWQALDGQDAPAGAINAVMTDSRGRVWAGTDHGLFYYESSAWLLHELIQGEPPPRVSALTEDRDGRLWVGIDRGFVFAADPHDPTHITDWLGSQPGQLVNPVVQAMAFADDGSLWLGTLGGVSRYDGEIWQAIHDTAVQGRSINTILTDSDGITWVGTADAGLGLWDGKKWQSFTTTHGLPDNQIIGLFQDSKGRLWASTRSGVGYRAPTGKWQLYSLKSGIVGFPVYSIAQDASGDLLFATEAGVSRLRADGTFTSLKELAGERVTTVHRGRDGTLWFGTAEHGLFRLTDNRFQMVQRPDDNSFGSVIVNGIVTSPDGALWVATADEGLWCFRDGQWSRVDAPLPTPSILTLRYLDHSLWVGTRQGFARYDGTTWQTYVGDGLPSPDVLAIAPGPTGVIWIGTGAGLVRYEPEKLPPWVSVESVNLIPVADGKVALAGDTLQDLRLEGGDLATRREQIRFLTQLEGLDPAPLVHTSGQVVMGERRLAPGTYHLRVWARDNALNYSAPVEVEIRVPAVFRLPGGRAIPSDVVYATLAFGFLALGGIILAGGLGWSMRRQMQARDLAEAERQRTAVERQFNPYISGEPVRQADMFFGRDELLNRILNALHQNSIMIYGERRIGKTTLLYQLGQALREADDAEWAFIPVSIDLEGTPHEHFFYVLMEAIWGVLQAYLTETPPDLNFHSASPSGYTDRAFSADLREIVDILKAVVAPRHARIILLMDEMDVIDGYDRLTQLQLRRVFMSPLAEHLGAVVAGVQISKAWDRVESPWYNLFHEVPLEPFDNEQATELLIEPVRGVYEWDPAALDFVLARAEGRPHRLQQIALESVNQMLAADRLRITLEDVQAADALIEGTRER